MGYRVGIDLGGTNIAVGICNADFQVIGRADAKTRAPRPAAEIADDIRLTTMQAVENAGIDPAQIERIGVGTPGTVNPLTGVVGLAANLGFHDTPLGTMLSERFKKPVTVENDANAAAYGELTAGAGKGLSSIVMITIGTGIGGGVIIDRQIYSGFGYKGGELGHVGMIYQGEPCSCGRRGCIESYCSATALIRITREAMRLHPDSQMWALCENRLEKVSGRTAFLAMRDGDAAAQAVVGQYVEYFAYAVSGLINLLQPQAVVVGGGVSKEGERLLEPLRRRTYEQTFNHQPEHCTQILQAKLGNDAGIIGAAFMGKMQ